MKLYDIQEEFRDIVRRIEEADGELTPEVEASLAINDYNLRQKAEGYTAVITEAEAEAKAIREQEVRLAALRQSKMRLAGQLRDRLAQALKTRGPLKLAHWSLSSYDTEVVDVQCDPKYLPPHMVRVKTTFEPDKTAIKAALDAGESFPGVGVVTNTHLRIK